MTLSACATDTTPSLNPERPTEYRTTLDELLLQNARRCDSGFEYPSSLVDGIGTQLVEELRCMDDTILEFYESCEEAGCIYADGPQPLAIRPEVIAALQAAALEMDDWISITAGYRDVSMQYYSRWYNENCDSSFDAAIPGESNHQGGRAVDVRYYTHWWDALLNNGFEHPIVTDNPHFELVGTAAFRARSAELQSLSIEAYQRLWNRNNPDDRITEDGVYGASTKVRLGLAPVEGFPIGPCEPGSGGGDVGVDAGPDAGTDVGTDVGTDTDTDTSTDTSTDAGTDAATDASTDTGTDAATDAATDSSTDASTDTGTDARNDADPSDASTDTLSDTSASGDSGPPPVPAFSIKSTRDPESRGCASTTDQRAAWPGLLLVALAFARRRRVS